MQRRAHSVVGRAVLVTSAAITLFCTGIATAAPGPPPDVPDVPAEPSDPQVAVGLPPVPPTTVVVAVGRPPVPSTPVDTMAPVAPSTTVVPDPVAPSTTVVPDAVPPSTTVVPDAVAQPSTVTATPRPLAAGPATPTSGPVVAALDAEGVAEQVTSLVVGAATQAALALRR